LASITVASSRERFFASSLNMMASLFSLRM
jgi:hypothetical protein